MIYERRDEGFQKAFRKRLTLKRSEMSRENVWKKRRFDAFRRRLKRFGAEPTGDAAAAPAGAAAPPGAEPSPARSPERSQNTSTSLTYDLSS